MAQRITKGKIADFVKHKLATDEKWAKAALLKIFEHQTADEQAMGTTNMYNGVGFTGCDADICSSLFKQLKDKGWLSPKQMTIVFKKMKKYSRQIIMISDESKLFAAYLKNVGK